MHKKWLCKVSVISLWEGVYSNFQEAGGDLDASDSEIWINKQIDKAESALQRYENKESLSKDYPLPIVVAMELCSKDTLSILDFGGGMGIQYLEILAKVPKAKNSLIYHVVDGASSINRVPQKIKDFSNITFYSDLNEVVEKIDIIHIGSTLQYVEAWQALLQLLIDKFNPTYFVFSDLMVGDIPQFVSHQIFYDKKIPVWMLNYNSVISFFTKREFDLKYQTYFDSNILGHDTLPNFLIPENSRIQNTVNIILQKGNLV